MPLNIGVIKKGTGHTTEIPETVNKDRGGNIYISCTNPGGILNGKEMLPTAWETARIREKALTDTVTKQITHQVRET